MKAKNTGAALRTQTAMNQYDSMEYAMGMQNDTNHPSYKKLTAYSGNKHTGHSNDGRLVNMGRGPTKGNDGKCGHSGFEHSGLMPDTSGVPAVPKQGSTRDSINRGAQVRTPGGTRAFDPKAGQNYSGNADKINFGRGPTKGNNQ
jgi:hypothetical protein